MTRASQTGLRSQAQAFSHGVPMSAGSEPSFRGSPGKAVVAPHCSPALARRPRCECVEDLEVSYSVSPELPIDKMILCLLRVAGGRLDLFDLEFELRWRGVLPERASSAMNNLVRDALLRGPLSKALAYELTTRGWDAAAAFAACDRSDER